ncbi:hypothetical protein [Streptomyces sp. GESEQ-35]|uniref:hypothetical protein n=1 Tax=Streptomyces sp. GESEQ-35 TaxID=2812657 RepID=UPI001B3303FF|nr:hypothetical protein [Streptomyces sp. GESEQ-35]
MARKSTFRFLRPPTEDVIADAVEVEGVFPLLPPRFEPLDAEPNLDDGVPPTKLGKAVMEWYGDAHACDPSATPTSVVRAIEAISATPDNFNAVRKARWRRNHAGQFSVAQLEVLVPLIRPATVQPRMAASAQRIMRDNYSQSLIHEVSPNLRIHAQSAEHLRNITDAQKNVRHPHTYVGPAEKEFADSLALEGIREELRGYVYDLHVSDDERGHLVETDDGWTRVTVAQSFMGALMETDADLSTLHWENPDGTLTVRPHTAETILRAHEALQFEEAPFAVWPTTHTRSGVSSWVAGASPEALATIRMMTARMDIGIAVRPYRENSDHDVVYADMARFHVKGQNPTLWGKADDEAFKARTVVKDLVRRNYITPEQRDIFFGDVVVPWADDALRAPFRNRVVAITKVMVSTVVADPATPGRYPEVRRTLKRLRVSNSPLQAATTTASLAGLVAGLDGDGEMGQFTAAISRTFRKPELREISDTTKHRGSWTDVIDLDAKEIAAGARKELLDAIGAGNTRVPGKHQRALAILALVAHAANPALRDYRQPIAGDESGRTRRYPSSMTLTGRGGRGGVRPIDADTICFNAARSPHGINQLESIINAATLSSPTVPLDPETGEELLEEWLRIRWQVAPDATGKPAERTATASGMTSTNGFQQPELDLDDEASEVGTSRTPDFDPLSDSHEWNAEVITLIDEISQLADRIATLSQVRANAQLADVDEEDFDPDDESLPFMIDKIGIDPEVENGSDESLDKLRNFLKRGVLGYLKQRARL